MPSVVRSAWLLAFVAANRSLLVLKYHAHFIAARPNDLLAALKVRLLLTIALFGRLANGGAVVQQRRVDGDAVALLVPGDDAFGERLRHDHVAPDVVLHPLLERLGDRRCGAEIHVRDAHAGDDVILVGEAGVDRAVPL